MHCVIHIGRPKTGSTAIQLWLYLNADSLSEYGYFLSKVCGSPNNKDMAAYFGGEGHNGLNGWRMRRSLRHSESTKSYLDSFGFLASFEAEVTRASESFDVFVLTSEHFSSGMKTVPAVSEFVSYLNGVFDSLEVIAYVRPQTLTIPSGWSTELKGGATHSLEQHVQKVTASSNLRFDQFAELWGSVVGAENCKFFWFNSSSDWDVREHFCENALGDVKGSELVFPVRRANKALNRWQAESYRGINKAWPLWMEGSNRINPKNRKMRMRADKLLVGRGPQISLDKQQKQRVLEHFASSNEEFDRRYRSGTPLADLQ